MTKRRLGFLIVVLGAAAAAVLVATTALRDPLPRFLARHGTLIRSAEDSVENGGPFRSRAVRLTSSSGLAVDLAYSWVGDSSATRRPLVLLAGGHKTGRAAVDLIGDPRGFVVAAISYPFDGDHDIKGLAVVPAVPAIRRAILDTPPALMLALDYLRGLPFVDTTRVELVGVSLGAPFAVIAGAIDPRVSRVWSVHGAGEPYTLINHNLRRRIPFKPARAVVASLANLLASGPRIAPERWASRIAPRRFVMINATEDERIPRSAVTTLWESAREPKELIWMPGQHVQGKRTEIVRRLVAMLLERIAADSAGT